MEARGNVKEDMHGETAVWSFYNIVNCGTELDEIFTITRRSLWKYSVY